MEKRDTYYSTEYSLPDADGEGRRLKFRMATTEGTQIIRVEIGDRSIVVLLDELRELFEALGFDRLGETDLLPEVSGRLDAAIALIPKLRAKATRAVSEEEREAYKEVADELRRILVPIELPTHEGAAIKAKRNDNGVVYELRRFSSGAWFGPEHGGLFDSDIRKDFTIIEIL